VSHIEREKDYGTVLMRQENANLNISDDNNEIDNSFGMNNDNNISESAANFREMKTRKTMDASKILQLKSLKNSKQNLNLSRNDSKKDKKKSYGFKAKSIEKNIDKYPVEDSNKYLIKEINRPYTDPLTIQQDMIPQNLRGKKYYMNYMNNIIDKDLKVKDQFKVDHWKGEVLGKQIKYIHVL